MATAWRLSFWTLTPTSSSVSSAPCCWLPPDPAWQFPWLRLHVVMRDLLTTAWGKNWPIVKRELARCAELRRAMMQAGWFN
jgi:hypothetical protein